VIIEDALAVRTAILRGLLDLTMLDKNHLFKKNIKNINIPASKINIRACGIAIQVESARCFPFFHTQLSGMKKPLMNVLA
jgi:hypothetical protein